MSKPKPARYRTTNWSTYNEALRKRGSLLIWLDKEMTWHAPHEGRPGAPAGLFECRNPVLPICCPTGHCVAMSRKGIKVLFKLPLRQTAGMVASLLRLAGLDWPVPDYSTLCRRQKTLKVQIPYRRSDGPLNLLVPSRDIVGAMPCRVTDSTGIKFLGDGALSWFLSKPLPGGKWQARKHGVQGRRQWRKVHLAMDTATSDIRAVEFTPQPGRPLSGHCWRNALPGKGQPRPAGPVGPDPRGRGHRHRDRGWCLRYPPMPRRRHRTRRHGNHTDAKERSGLERGLPGRQGAQRDPLRHASLRSGILETPLGSILRMRLPGSWWTGYHARSRVEAKPLRTSLRDALTAGGCDA